jgi:hypothetical protein
MSAVRYLFTLVTVVTFAATFASPVAAQTESTNDQPNPYQSISGWAEMPGARHWGSTSAVDVDIAGVHVWVAERCGQSGCKGPKLDPILKFDASGNIYTAEGDLRDLKNYVRTEN